jgi:hypothetical protein
MRVRAMPACNRDFCKTPAIRRHEADRSVNRFKIRIGSFPDFFPRQQIDRIERRHLDPEVGRLSAKRTDPACNIQNSLPNQLLRFEEKIPPVLFERVTEQHNSIKLQPTLRLDRPISHSRCRSICPQTPGRFGESAENVVRHGDRY